ncbi:hypothetical protein ACO0QE_003937 [Hanseniaspora vineae]
MNRQLTAFAKIAPISKTVARSPIRQFHTSLSHMQSYQKWADLDKTGKQNFIRSFVNLHVEKHPCSKSNVSYQALAHDMEEYDDTPYIFGILYDEIRAVAQKESVHNTDGSGFTGDPDFAKLLSSK